jgi:DNA N-6-adenine-methyltransferase (Dam)
MTNGRSQQDGFRHERPQGRSVEWYTPPELFEALGLAFDLDPAAPPGGVPWVPAARYFSRFDDGLSQPWQGRVWLNPPYGRDVGRWLDRLAEHGDGLALVFARTDTAWFHRAFARATAACFIKGRLRFVAGDGQAATSAAGAPSLLLAYGLPCALALSASGLGRTCLVPGGQLA